MRIYKPDKKGMRSLRAVFLLLSVILIFVIKHYIPVNMVVFIGALALATVDIFVLFIYLPLYFASLRYEASHEEIIRHGGVFIKTRQSVRFSTVQYTTVITTPFSQYTGLNFLILFVYGGQLRLLFLRQSDVLDILRIIDNKGEGDSINIDVEV